MANPTDKNDNVNPSTDEADRSPMTHHDLGSGVWHDLDGSGYIALDLTKGIERPQARTVEGIELSPKAEYHCSLVAVRTYLEDPAEERTIADAVKGFLQSNDLRFAGLGEDRYLCRKDDRMTIVTPVRIDGIEEFVAFIETLIPRYVPPFLHTTLLKSETAEHGISVNSLEALGRYRKKLLT